MAGPNIPGVTDLVEIGRGGFGVVYRARETDLDRAVAVKILPGGLDERGRERFDRERRAMGALSSHPNIVTVYRSGISDDGEPYLVMELVEGGSTEARLRSQGPLRWTDAVDIGIGICGAVETAHESGVLHRDIKPGNILVSSLGEPKLGDFGIARLQGAPETRSAAITASIGHAAPEIIDGRRPTTASDVYAVASTLHELMSGSSPFSRATDESIIPMLARIAREPVPDLRPLGVPEPVCAVLEKAMAKDPQARYPTARALGEALEAAATAAGHRSRAIMRIEGVRLDIEPDVALPTDPDRTGEGYQSVIGYAAAFAAAPDAPPPPAAPPTTGPVPAGPPGSTGPVPPPAPAPPVSTGPVPAGPPGSTGPVPVGPAGPPVSTGPVPVGPGPDRSSSSRYALLGGGAVAVVAAIVAALVLLGGGGDEDPEATPTPTEAAAPSATPDDDEPTPTPESPTEAPTTPPGDDTGPLGAPVSADVSAAVFDGVAAGDYGPYVAITDATGAITVEVPAAWNATELVDSSGVAQSSLTATTDLDLVATYLVPGVTIAAAQYDAGFDVGQPLEVVTVLNSACPLVRRDPITVAGYTGEALIIGPCDANGAHLAAVAVTDAEGRLGLSITMQLTDGQDTGAVRRILDSVRVDGARLPTA